MNYRPLFALLFFALIFFCCNSCDNYGKEIVNGFFEKMSGSWRLQTRYTVNGITLDNPNADQFSILRVDTLSDDELKYSLPSNNQITLNDFIKVTNSEYNLLSLFWGTMIGKKRRLPYQMPLTVNTNNCLNCKYGDIQMIDIKTCKTDSFEFEITRLDETEMYIRFLANRFNRYVNGIYTPDTIELKFSRGEDIYDVKKFNINDYAKKKWIRFESNSFCGQNGVISFPSGGIDNNCLCLSDQISSVCTDIDLKSAMGSDNQLTVSFWVRPESLDKPRQVIYSKYSVGGYGYAISLKYNRIEVAINDGFGNLGEHLFVRTLQPNEWNHICLSYNQQDLGLYLNGLFDSKVKSNSFLNDANGKILIGSSDALLPDGISPNGFQGCLDEFIFFEKSLSQGEVFDLYQWHLGN